MSPLQLSPHLAIHLSLSLDWLSGCFQFMCLRSGNAFVSQFGWLCPAFPMFLFICVPSWVVVWLVVLFPHAVYCWGSQFFLQRCPALSRWWCPAVRMSPIHLSPSLAASIYTGNLGTLFPTVSSLVSPTMSLSLSVPPTVSPLSPTESLPECVPVCLCPPPCLPLCPLISHCFSPTVCLPLSLPCTPLCLPVVSLCLPLCPPIFGSRTLEPCLLVVFQLFPTLCSSCLPGDKLRFRNCDSATPRIQEHGPASETPDCPDSETPVCPDSETPGWPDSETRGCQLLCVRCRNLAVSRFRNSSMSDSGTPLCPDSETPLCHDSETQPYHDSETPLCPDSETLACPDSETPACPIQKLPIHNFLFHRVLVTVARYFLNFLPRSPTCNGIQIP